jgi:hypothetical protein
MRAKTDPNPGRSSNADPDLDTGTLFKAHFGVPDRNTVPVRGNGALVAYFSSFTKKTTKRPTYGYPVPVCGMLLAA